MLLVREVSGPTSARVGESLVYTATRFNREQPSAAEMATINWVVKSGDTVLAEGQGPSMTFVPGENVAGATIIAMAYRNSPTPSVSATTMVQPPLTAEGFRAKLRAVGDLYPDLLTAPSEASSLQELVSSTTGLRYELEDLLESLGTLPIEDAEAPAEEEAAERPRLAIVVGHTARAPGAVAGAPINQQEYHWNLDLAELMQAAAAEAGLDTRVCLRDRIGIEGAYAAAEAYQPGAIIELHFNSFSSASASGTETLYVELHPDSKKLAGIVQARMLEALGPGQKDRGVKDLQPGQNGHRNLTQVSSIPSVLVEPFFGSNRADCQAAAANKSAYAAALVEATREFLLT